MKFQQAGLKLLTATDEGLKELKAILDKEASKEPAEKSFKDCEFAHDVKDLLELLEKEKSTKQSAGHVVVDTDDFEDILLCGTEVAGSCQRVDGDPSLNKGLLGYLMDGKIRLLAVKTGSTSQDHIEARCLLRLLWDGEKPVLLRDRLYPDLINPEYKSALNAMAKKKAKALGVPLVSRDGDGEAYPRDLVALGGPAPFEYSDAAGGLQAQGRYTVTGVKLFT
ncbi:MAG: hypothetical protein ACHQVK_03360 [Candidatus Paceibacterales bacterium]